MSKNLSLYSNANENMTVRTFKSRDNKVEKLFDTSKNKFEDSNEKSDIKSKYKFNNILHNTSLDFNNKYESRSPRIVNTRNLMGMPKIN